MKIVAVVQARMSSTRLPGKVLKDLGGQPMILFLLNRLKASSKIDEIIVATTDQRSDDLFCETLSNHKIPYFRGSEHDVLGRFRVAADTCKADVVVRITGDCPFIDPKVVDTTIDAFITSNVTYVSNRTPPTYPDGLDTEVFSIDALREADSKAKTAYEREHVTPYLYTNDFPTLNVSHDIDCSDYRWTVDEPEDLLFAQEIVERFSPETGFSWISILNLVQQHPELKTINNQFKRDEGSSVSTGQKLWKRAKKVIPGGSMLLSKRSELHLPELWPSYFSKTSGYQVWDLDGNKFDDLYFMGVGTNALGYSHPEVDDAVLNVVKSGNLSTLNAPEEVYLAEKLVELDPWAGMVRFARSGGEANSIAIRIARAAAGKDHVAVCGYHGWHDWYLSANLGNEKSLDGHLLPGLSTNGVPDSLRGLTHPFSFNDLDELSKIIDDFPIGVVKMEVMRSHPPKEGFLESVRELCNKNGIVLIFDECTSGFRETHGGLYKKFGVEPDIAVYGKTLGNGYAVSAVVGREEVMQSAQETFISSTFWTERIGSAAALKTLEVMANQKPWLHTTRMGKKVQSLWADLANETGLGIEVGGLPSLASYTFKSENHLAYKTYVTQEMLERGFLAGTAMYLCLAHDDLALDRYQSALREVFSMIAKFEDGLDVNAHLKNPVVSTGFARLN